MTIWLKAVGMCTGSIGVQREQRGARSVAVRITTRDEAARTAGSRYAPVSTLADYDLSGRDAFVGRPCEASALRALRDVDGVSQSDNPPVLSFFCAGVPSQLATDSLVRRFGIRPEDVDELRYRGNGWPGRFSVVDIRGRTGSLDYAESWGSHLGRDLPWRCKLCPDGTGEAADIAVGDFWESDERGFPTFSEGDGNSVVIARTMRGHEWLCRAAAEQVIEMQALDLDAVARVQPLQRERRQTLVLRLAARVLAGRPVPRYRGYRLLRSMARRPRPLLKGFLGTLERSLRRGAFRTPDL